MLPAEKSLSPSVSLPVNTHHSESLIVSGREKMEDISHSANFQTQPDQLVSFKSGQYSDRNTPPISKNSCWIFHSGFTGTQTYTAWIPPLFMYFLRKMTIIELISSIDPVTGPCSDFWNIRGVLVTGKMATSRLAGFSCWITANLIWFLEGFIHRTITWQRCSGSIGWLLDLSQLPKSSN